MLRSPVSSPPTPQDLGCMHIPLLCFRPPRGTETRGQPCGSQYRSPVHHGLHRLAKRRSFFLVFEGLLMCAR